MYICIRMYVTTHDSMMSCITAKSQTIETETFEKTMYVMSYRHTIACIHMHNCTVDVHMYKVSCLFRKE